MRLKIKVTKDVLKQSMYCGTKQAKNYDIPTNCAIAIAVREIVPLAQVSNTAIILEEGHIVLPKEVRCFIRSFDNLRSEPSARLHLSELEFEIDIPEEVIASIDIKEAHEIIKNSSTLELVEEEVLI